MKTSEQRPRSIVIITTSLLLAMTSGCGKALPVSPSPTPSATEQATQASTAEPPACTFPLAQLTIPETLRESYAFSEAKVVLTAPKGNYYTIAQWLPDNQQVLITEVLRNQAAADAVSPETIELFDPETGALKAYATRPTTHEPPSWDPALNAVLYPVMDYYYIDAKNHIAKFKRELWVAYGSGGVAQMLADDLTQLAIAISAGGSETVYFSDKQLSRLDRSLHNPRSVPFDPAQWDYAKRGRDLDPVSFRAGWQPGTPLLVLYSDPLMTGRGYAFVVDIETGKVCDLKLEGWATQARWSPDGRYLAIGMATYSHPSALLVLDSETGSLTMLDRLPRGVDGHLYVGDLIWAPDNHHVLVAGSVIPPQTPPVQALYLVDIDSGESAEIAAFGSSLSSRDSNWAWSQDGSKLLLRCPTDKLDQICLIAVDVSAK